jgi:2-dehydro-3-deoxyphosphogluconate aldolase/(4S)-4-hydroxy-2-oxoglutarate aldolase
MDVSLVDRVLDAGPVMAVVVARDPAKAVKLARALAAAGSPLVEITLRTPKALAAIKAVAEEVPGAIVGAGTILAPKDYEAAVQAGAIFGVSPGTTPALLKTAATGPIPFLPGVATASEIMTAMEHGFSRFKFFPAEQAGGAAALRSLEGPLPEARFCPTGGIGAGNAAQYWALSNVACVGGSWIAPSELIEAEAYEKITALAKEAAVIRAKVLQAKPA